jgi:hypothetical protein
MGDSNGDGDGGGDGSGGNSPSRQGAGIETSVPRNWSSMAAALQNFLWMDADLFRVFASEALYRQRGDVRGHQGGPTPGGGAARGGPAPPGGVATSWPSSVSCRKK